MAVPHGVAAHALDPVCGGAWRRHMALRPSWSLPKVSRLPVLEAVNAPDAAAATRNQSTSPAGSILRVCRPSTPMVVSLPRSPPWSAPESFVVCPWATEATWRFSVAAK